MADLSGFDANQVEPNTGFDVIPAGDYDAVIVDSKKKPTKDGNGEYLELKLQICQKGDFQNRNLWDRLNLKNQSVKAVDIAKSTLSSICRAVNVLTPSDSAELHNKPMRVTVAVKKDNSGNDRNEVKSYKPRQSGPAPTTTAQPAPSGAPAPTPWG